MLYDSTNYRKNSSIQEQYFILPGYYDWQQFKTIESAIKQVRGVRICYLDGCVEFMTIGEEHEKIKSIIHYLR